MATPPTWPRWLWPEPAPEPSLESWRTVLTSYTERVLVVTAGIPLALVLGSYWPGTVPAAVWFAAAVYLVVVLASVSARTPPRVRAAILLAAFQVISPGLLIAFGPSPTPYLCLLVSCVLAAVLIGVRTSLAFLASALLLLGFAARAHLARHAPADGGESVLFWFRVSVVWFTLTCWLVYVTNWLTVRIERALRQKGQALAAVEQAGERHLLSEQRRAATEGALIEAQRHEAVGRIAGGVSHDFNNALFVILGWNDLLSRGDVSESQRVQGHEAIAQAGRHAAELARRLGAMGRQHPGTPHAIALRPLVEDGVRYLARLLPDSIRVSSELSDVPAVAVDPGLLQQVLLNLALEARDAMPDGGRLAFELGVDHGAGAEPPHWIVLSVRDTGHGLDAAARPDSAAPGAPGRGTSGIGLVATRAIIERSGGRLDVEREAGRGTRCRVRLPVAASSVSRTASGSGPSPASLRAAILVVEDDEAVRGLMVVALRAQGHRVREAADGDRALAMLEERGVRDDLLCIDGVLPGVPATTIIERFRLLRPERPVLLCSGGLDTPELHALVQDGRLPFLLKPFTPGELAAKVAELLAGHDPAPGPASGGP